MMTLIERLDRAIRAAESVPDAPLTTAMLQEARDELERLEDALALAEDRVDELEGVVQEVEKDNRQRDAERMAVVEALGKAWANMPDTFMRDMQGVIRQEQDRHYRMDPTTRFAFNNTTITGTFDLDPKTFAKLTGITAS